MVWIIFIGMFLLTVTIIVAMIFAVMALMAFFDAKAEIASRPREPMGWCRWHGFIRKKYMLGLPGTSATICPKCWAKSYEEAGKQ